MGQPESHVGNPADEDPIQCRPNVVALQRKVVPDEVDATDPVDAEKCMTIVYLAQGEKITSRERREPRESILLADRQLRIQVKASASTFEPWIRALYADTTELLKGHLSSRGHVKLA